MTHENKDHTDRPHEGARCLAATDGYWAPGRIQRVNEDDTFTIEFDEKQTMLMPYWYGVTSYEISVNDAALWPSVFERLTSGSSVMTKATFGEALSRAGYRVEDEKMDEFWTEQCKELFGVETAAGEALSQDQAYQLLVRAGCSAKQFIQADADSSEPVYYKLYWNLIRMGGRQPSEIKRCVTLDDAFCALGVERPHVDDTSLNRISDFQQSNDVELPPNLSRFLCCYGIGRAVTSSHPNNPQLVLPGDEYCEFQRNPPLPNAHAEYALTLLFPHQGDHVWAAVFNEGDEDAQVYVTWDDEHWALTAPTVGMFFWDLAQTGLIWYQNTGHNGGRPIEKTDIGVTPRRTVTEKAKQT